MSSLLRRMQRIASRGPKAKKAAINRQFATKIGVHNERAKDLLARSTRHSVRLVATPKALRRSKRSLAWLKARAAARSVTASPS